MSQTSVLELSPQTEGQQSSRETDYGNGRSLNESTQPTPLTRGTIFKMISAGFSFFFAGCNDGSLGALIPYLLQSYHISTAFVSIVYTTTFLGWLLAALSNAHLMRLGKLSTGKMLLLGAALQLIANAIRTAAPPFGLYCVSFFLTALGMGFQDAHANTFVASVQGAHRWLAFIHSMYAFGLLTGPFMATAIASHSHWNYFYALLIGIGSINVGLVLSAFGVLKKEHPAITQTSPPDLGQSGNSQALREMKESLKLRSFWLLSLFYFCFLGSAFTVGGSSNNPHPLLSR